MSGCDVEGEREAAVTAAAAAAAKSHQLCPTLGDPIDGSPPGSAVTGTDSPGKNTGVGCHLQGPNLTVP